MDCQHTLAQSRGGEPGSWCVYCGTKVYAVHDRPCQECRFFRPDPAYQGRVGYCYMRVTADLRVTYRLDRGHTPGVEFGLCFEAVPVPASQ